MKVEYTLTPEDYAAATFERSNVTWRSRLVQSVIIGALFLLLVATLADEGVPWPFVVLLFLPVAVSVFFPFLNRLTSKWVMASLLRRGGGSATPMTLEVRPEGLAVTTENTVSLTLWEGIDRIALSDTHVVFYGNKGVVQILPRRAFADERDFREFVESARSYPEAAKLKSEASQP